MQFCNMKADDIVIAPQTADAEELLAEWKKSHIGGRRAFYEFMTTPSADRDIFLVSVRPERVWRGSSLSITYSATKQNDDGVA